MSTSYLIWKYDTVFQLMKILSNAWQPRSNLNKSFDL